jgi:hypothetical protein
VEGSSVEGFSVGDCSAGAFSVCTVEGSTSVAPSVLSLVAGDVPVLVALRLRRAGRPVPPDGSAAGSGSLDAVS